MAATETKRKILDAALHLFNRDGLMNVRLQHIADEAFVSIGNMTYHFRNKELIVNTIWQELLKKQETLLAEFRVVPLFEDIERQIRSTFQLQQLYAFFYVDTLEIVRAFPDIRHSHRQHQHWQMKQVEMMVFFNIARGVFRAEPEAGYYRRLARQYWMTSDLWLKHRQILGEEVNDFEAYRQAMWCLLQGIFTERGWLEFQQLNALIEEGLVS
ncbi:MAG TPA: TetR/AcrR family transcriptional regulator [Saprospiraceae bacterium]|nr:TetR/AcrR family transcriptional regulator [Saprospiraceae bacterium]HMP23967.1 TetR/AcrR family transcriptional regulator [Saprospiraceae bacterium]